MFVEELKDRRQTRIRLRRSRFRRPALAWRLLHLVRKFGFRRSFRGSLEIHLTVATGRRRGGCRRLFIGNFKVEFG